MTNSNELDDKPDHPHLKRTLKVHERAPTVSAEMTDEGAVNLTIGEKSSADEALSLMAALGLANNHMLGPFLGQLSNAVSSKGAISEPSLQFALGFIQSIEPETEAETLLAAQMAAIHVCAMESSRRYLWAETVQGKDSAERALNKLTRTFATQMETLKRNRAKAQQTVRVERVTVNEGGQAIVGAVQTGGRGDEEK